MKTLLVHITNFAVMFHMTFGCGWHHGLGSEQGCTHTLVGCTDNHDGEPIDCGDQHHDAHDHDLPASPSTPAGDDEGSKHSHDHFGCSDDGCNAAKVAKFAFEPVDYSIQYLGGVESPATARSLTNPGLAFDPLPDCPYTANSVRLHLLFGVQLL